MIAFCPHCDNEFYVPVDLGGKTVKCSKCKKKVQAPEAPDVSGVAVGSVSIQLSVSEGKVGDNQQKAGAGIGFKEPVVSPGVGDNQQKTGAGIGLKEPVVSSGVGGGSGVLRRSSGKRGGSGGPSQAFKKSLKRRVNLYRGINRLILVLSMAALLPGLPELVRYLLDRSVWRAKDIVGFFMPWPAVGFVSLWAVYGIGLCIACSFGGRDGSSRRAGLRRLTFAVSVLPFLPGIGLAIRDLVTKHSFQVKEVLGYFTYWSVAGFAGVWVAYVAALFVFRGFYDMGAKTKPKPKPTLRKGAAKKPSEPQSSRSGGWRTT